MLPISARIRRQGAVLVCAVLAYGMATIVFGLSHSFWLTFACLAVSGSADATNTIIRNLVRQLETPDAMRGRMIGVNMLFFMGGPQLGELEAGLVAQWFGARLSVITGGVGCLVATVLLALTSPALWTYRSGGGRSTAR
jgi:MFS family permease